MLVDRRLVALIALAVALVALHFVIGWNGAFIVMVIGAIAWSVSPLNGPSGRYP